MLNLHSLKVYQKALPIGAEARQVSASWGKRHAVVEQFCRAAESIVLNIAEGARLQSGPEKARRLDYALGSSLECAACLDIACIKGRTTPEQARSEKVRLLEVTRMLIGLRKKWAAIGLSDDSGEYVAESSADDIEVLFHHESLDVYRVALEFVGWFVSVPGASDLADRLCREIDKAATSVVLNVAEGNGRYSVLDQRHFWDIAAASAVKTRVYLDLHHKKAGPSLSGPRQGRELLGRILSMLSGSED